MLTGSQEMMPKIKTRIGALLKEDSSQRSFEEKLPKSSFFGKISSMHSSPTVLCHSSNNP